MLSIEEGDKHYFSLVIYGFCSNNTPYSGSLSFLKFIFLLTPVDTRDCYYFKSKGEFKPSAHYGCINGRGPEFSSFSQSTLIQISFVSFISSVSFCKFCRIQSTISAGVEWVPPH